MGLELHPLMGAIDILNNFRSESKAKSQALHPTPRGDPNRQHKQTTPPERPWLDFLGDARNPEFDLANVPGIPPNLDVNGDIRLKSPEQSNKVRDVAQKKGLPPPTRGANSYVELSTQELKDDFYLTADLPTPQEIAPSAGSPYPHSGRSRYSDAQRYTG